jgi:hypothetical protein
MLDPSPLNASKQNRIHSISGLDAVFYDNDKLGQLPFGRASDDPPSDDPSSGDRTSRSNKRAELFRLLEG